MDILPGTVASLSTAAAPPALRLFGRDQAQQSLLSLLMGFEAQDSPGALLIGEGGTGKTSLLQAVGASVPGILHSRARIGDRLVPYATLARLLRQLLRQAPQGLDESTRQELSALLPEWRQAADLPGEAGPPSPQTVHDLLRRAAPDVVAWTLDDLHLADDASAEWLQSLLLGAAPSAMPWVISSEPPQPGTAVETLLEAAAGLKGVAVLTLAPLQHAPICEWLLDEHSATLSARQADVLAARLLAGTAGSPLHLRLLLDDAQALARAGQAPEGAPLITLQGLIGVRLARLPPAALALARVASVTGQDFSADAAMDFTGLTRAEFDQAQAEMQAQGVWADSDFAHHRLREAARQATPEAMARSLHAHCAQWLESHDGSAARIAAHWQAAGQPQRALPALRAAADYARQLRCVGERMACLARAAMLAEETGQPDLAFECTAEAFEAHTEAVRSTDGAALLSRLQRLARTPEQLARCQIQQAWYAMMQGRLEEAIDLGELAVAAAEQLGNEELAAPARQYLGTALGVVGRLGSALPLLQAAETWVQRAIPLDERASYYSNLAAVLDNLGRAEDARTHHQQALALAAHHADATHRATLLANYALSRFDAGDPIGGRELAQKAQSLIDSGESASHPAGFVAVLLASCERALGRYAAALAWCDRAENALAQQNAARMPVAHLQRAHVWVDLGQHERACELLGGAGLPLGQMLPPRHSVRWLLLLARAQARLGEDARPMLAQAHARLPAEGWPELSLWLRAEEAHGLPAVDAAEALAGIAEQAAAARLPGVALGAWLQAALLGASAHEPALARRAADTALALMTQGVESTHVDRALRWLAPARALALSGEWSRARGLMLRGQQWLIQTATEQVPPELVHGFLERHPLNLQLRETLVPKN
jgi:tetratricopeptide (TPR) repeat protein